MSGCGRESLPDVWKWSEDPPGCPRAVDRPSQMPAIGRDYLPDVRKLSKSDLGILGGTLGCPVLVGWPSQMSGSGREALPVVREW